MKTNKCDGFRENMKIRIIHDILIKTLFKDY